MEHKDYNISQHFTRSELECPCCHSLLVDGRLVSLLEEIRGIFNTPIYVNSCFRCEKHNEEVGGVKQTETESGSAHLYGRAADIRQDKISNKMFHDEILMRYIAARNNKTNELELLGGLGEYDNFIHVDVVRAADNHLRRWKK